MFESSRVDRITFLMLNCPAKGFVLFKRSIEEIKFIKHRKKVS